MSDDREFNMNLDDEDDEENYMGDDIYGDDSEVTNFDLTGGDDEADDFDFDFDEVTPQESVPNVPISLDSIVAVLEAYTKTYNVKENDIKHRVIDIGIEQRLGVSPDILLGFTPEDTSYKNFITRLIPEFSKIPSGDASKATALRDTLLKATIMVLWEEIEKKASSENISAGELKEAIDGKLNFYCKNEDKGLTPFLILATRDWGEVGFDGAKVLNDTATVLADLKQLCKDTKKPEPEPEQQPEKPFSPFKVDHADDNDIVYTYIALSNDKSDIEDIKNKCEKVEEDFATHFDNDRKLLEEEYNTQLTLIRSGSKKQEDLDENFALRIRDLADKYKVKIESITVDSTKAFKFDGKEYRKVRIIDIPEGVFVGVRTPTKLTFSGDNNIYSELKRQGFKDLKNPELSKWNKALNLKLYDASSKDMPKTDFILCKQLSAGDKLTGEGVVIQYTLYSNSCVFNGTYKPNTDISEINMTDISQQLIRGWGAIDRLGDAKVAFIDAVKGFGTALDFSIVNVEGRYKGVAKLASLVLVYGGKGVLQNANYKISEILDGVMVGIRDTSANKVADYIENAVGRDGNIEPLTRFGDLNSKIILGRGLHGWDLCPFTKEAQVGWLFAGQTGSGKTAAMMGVVMQYIMAGSVVMMMDKKNVLSTWGVNAGYKSCIIHETDVILAAKSVIVFKNDILKLCSYYKLYYSRASKNSPKLPHVVVCIDEFETYVSEFDKKNAPISNNPDKKLAEAEDKENKRLFQQAQNAINDITNRIAKMGRSLGIHIMLGTQTPTRSVVPSAVLTNIGTILCGKMEYKYVFDSICGLKGAESIVMGGAVKPEYDGNGFMTNKLSRKVIRCVWGDTDPTSLSGGGEDLRAVENWLRMNGRQRVTFEILLNTLESAGVPIDDDFKSLYYTGEADQDVIDGSTVAPSSDDYVATLDEIISRGNQNGGTQSIPDNSQSQGWGIPANNSTPDAQLPLTFDTDDTDNTPPQETSRPHFGDTEHQRRDHPPNNSHSADSTSMGGFSSEGFSSGGFSSGNPSNPRGSSSPNESQTDFNNYESPNKRNGFVNTYEKPISMLNNPFTSYGVGENPTAFLNAFKITSGVLMEEIRKIFGDFSRVESIFVSNNGLMALNNIAFKPQFDPATIETMPYDMKEQIRYGHVAELFNFKDMYKFKNLQVIEVDNSRLAEGRMRRELGIHPRRSWDILFKKFKNLHEVRIGGTVISDASSAQAYDAGGRGGYSLTERLRSALNVGDNMLSSSRNSRFWNSRPVKAATGALGWTLGLKALTTIAFITGPWGLLFGAFAVAGALKHGRSDHNSPPRQLSQYDESPQQFSNSAPSQGKKPRQSRRH